MDTDKTQADNSHSAHDDRADIHAGDTAVEDTAVEDVAGEDAAGEDGVGEDGAGGAAATQTPREFNGPKGPEPTRYGDWEQKGRCSDF